MDWERYEQEEQYWKDGETIERLQKQVATLLAELDTAANRLEDCEREYKHRGDGTVRLRPFGSWAQEIRDVIRKAEGTR